MSRLDVKDKKNMFANMCKELKLILGGGPGVNKSETDPLVKMEPACGEEGVYVSTSGERFVKENYYRGRGRGASSWRGSRGKPGPYDRPAGPRENRKDEKGEVTKCRTCNSTFHYQNGCDVYKAMNPKKNNDEAHMVSEGDEEDIDFALAAYHRDALSQFTQEAKNCAALDTCCTSNIAGPQWLDMYLESLNIEDRAKVEGPLPSSKIFKFGNSEKLKSTGKYTIPVVIAGKKGSLTLDLIASDIALLMSKDAMKKAKMKLDVETDTCVVFGKKIDLMTTSSGHYCLPLTGETGETEIAWVLSVDLINLPEKEVQTHCETS